MAADAPSRIPDGVRLLYVFPSFGVGGAQVRFAALADALGPGLEHLIVSLDADERGVSLLTPSVRFRHWRVVAAAGPGLSLANLRGHRAVLRAERPDLLVTHNWGSIEWALANRLRPLCPHLHIVDGFGPEESASQLTRRVWARRVALSGASTVVVPSRTLLEVVTGVWRLDPGRVRHIPNGIDAERLIADAQTPLGLRRHPKELLFGALGGLRAEKNLGRLLRVAARLSPEPDWRLVIAGDGTERPQLEGLARRLGIADRVVFTGLVERPGALLTELDLFVLTSDTEQMPLSVLEAMALGLPVLATDVGDLRLMLPPQSGATCLFRPADEAGFATRLAALLASPAERRTLGELNRIRALDFDLETMVERYRRLLGELLATRPPASARRPPGTDPRRRSE